LGVGFCQQSWLCIRGLLGAYRRAFPSPNSASETISPTEPSWLRALLSRDGAQDCMRARLEKTPAFIGIAFSSSQAFATPAGGQIYAVRRQEANLSASSSRCGSQTCCGASPVHLPDEYPSRDTLGAECGSLVALRMPPTPREAPGSVT
jgi:hypothetical protein